MKKFFVLTASILFLGAGCFSLGDETATTTGPAGLFVSEDKGAAWSALSTFPTAEGVRQLSGVSVYRLVGDPQDPKTLYWLSREHGLFFSINDGKEWRRFDGPLASGFVYALAVHPKDKCTIFASNGGQVYKTDDCGRSWREMYREVRPDAQITSLVFNPFAPHFVYMAISSGELLQSVDSGRTWRVAHRFAVPVSEVVFDPLRPHILYVASKTDGLYRSENGGDDWESLRDAMKEYPGAAEYRRMVVHPKRAKEVFWVSTYGILASADGGDHWYAMDLLTPPGSAQIYGFAVNPNNDKEIYYTATINNRSALYKSVDGGAHWLTAKLPSDQIPSVLRIHPDKSSIMYLGFTMPQRQ